MSERGGVYSALRGRGMDPEVIGSPVDGAADPESSRRRRGVPVGHFVKESGLKYNPEAEAEVAFLSKTEDYTKRYRVPRIAAWQESSGIVPTVDAVMQTPVVFREGGRWQWRWKPTRVRGPVSHLAEYVQASEMKWALESSGNPFDTGGYGDLNPMSPTALIDRNDFIPFLNGPFYKQLYQYDYLAMHARAFELVNHSALAAAAVKILTRFVVGRGVSYAIKNDKVRVVWDEFWKRNFMKRRVRQMARDLTWQGELMLRYAEKQDGYLTMRLIDPSTCWEIVTDPEDFEHIYYYHFMWPTPYQIWTEGTIPVSQYVIQQVPPTQVSHVKINVSSQEKRGRSDLLPALPWLKRFNDYYNGIVIKAMLEANLVWKVKVHGDDRDVQNLANDANFTVMPPPGGQWIENDAVELMPLSAQLTSGRGSTGIGQQLASIVATSLNLPAEYFNIESGGAARATALVRTDPAVKTVEDRQETMEETVQDVYERVMEAAIRSGRISPDDIRKENPERADDEDDDGADAPVQAEFADRARQPSRLVLPGRRPVRAEIANGGAPVQAELADEDDDLPAPTSAHAVRATLVPKGGPRRATWVRG